MVDCFPYEVPEEYINMHFLKGRATVYVKFKIKENPNLEDCIFLIILDGYNAPVTARNFVDLVKRHFYDAWVSKYVLGLYKAHVMLPFGTMAVAREDRAKCFGCC
ncbi:Peptidylprolyl isomerase [Raphanus sativus]|nr:Peptidylprolyl isomerase [Raphanus sativus]